MEFSTIDWIALLLAVILILAVGIIAFLLRGNNQTIKTAAEKNIRAVELETQLESEQQRRGRAEESQSQMQEQHEKMLKESREQHAQALEEVRGQQREDGEKSAATIAELRAKLEGAQREAQEKIDLLQKARETMTAEFQTLAQSILEKNSKKFGEDSEKLLTPLAGNLEKFRQRIDAIHTAETTERASLKTEIKNLHENAVQISHEANNLALALKGGSKTQGDWGEMKLELLLENVGLREGEGYESQKSLLDDDKNQRRPDVVIKLPGGRHFIVDSKVSLRAFTDAMNADNEADKKVLLKNHVQAIRKHISDLAAKDYRNLHGINAPDMVFMFMGVEPALIEALMHDSNLFNDAYLKGVVLCSSMTLMPVLRSVEHIWRVDKQNRNADEIAKRGKLLYEKLAGFADEIDKIGASLKKAKESYDGANQKLRYAEGNLYGQAQKLIELGVNPSKKLPIDKNSP